jgi:hypothetical protein
MHWLVLLAPVLFVASAEAGSIRFTGRINSIAPAEEVVFVEDASDERFDKLVSVKYRDAEVVRLRRDTEQPAEWRERSTRLERWPAGTFIVIIGYAEPSGVVRADRIEIPKADLQ